jgi:hypothetical protein
MKTTKLIFTFVLVLLFAPSVIAQETENQLFAALKHSVKPEKIDEYKELMKKFASACKEYNYPFSYSVWQSSLPDFYYFYPVKDYNTVEELNSEAWKIIPKMEPDYAKKLFETIESWDQFFLRGIDSLSYNPENGPIIGEDLVYAEWWVNNYKTWTGWKYRNAFKRAIEMNKKAKSEYPIYRLQSDIGMNGPAIITVFWGKNEADLNTHQDKNWENFGEEVQEMINDFRSTTRKFEKIPFWFQKDLSYSLE